MKIAISQSLRQVVFHALAILGFVFLAHMQQAQAQNFKFGPRIGVASSGVGLQDLLIQDMDDLDRLKVSLQESSPEYQLGFFARVKLLGLYIQPEALITTSKFSYLVEDIVNSGDEVVTERRFGLEVPINAGIKLGPLRLQAGPVYRMTLSSPTEVANLVAMKRNFADATVGLQAGVGLDLGKKIVLDLKYEANLSSVTDEITVFGSTHQLSDHGGQLVGALGIAF
ncbi:outer membrane beta-barrel protein [Pontibacter sp. G13]|uniref:outer membrane beta-barrel protein n=1 Tax=Pontibacter sp. G13 TaxID=3074898 RepID=UPI0028891B5B|nr:outer membrane beta-barrel protein [Pontibacter sp. G13]WNJ16697.1 outer membrane beta-barrel protein [Pontibacter sp. G13]